MTTLCVRPIRATLFFFAAVAMGWPGATSRGEEGRKHLLERVDDVAVVQVYADGFEQLPLRERILLYHLTRAAIAGRDIFIDQKYRHSLAIRDLIEEVLTHPQGIESSVLAEIRRYAKLFWINNGPHNAITSRKNVLRCAPDEFAAAVAAAEACGAKLPKKNGEDTAALLRRMRPILFDANVDAQATNKAPPPGQDILQASANNFYEGVSLKDLVGFRERYPLNSKLVKTPRGELQERVWRAGFDGLVRPGMYAREIRAVIGHLEAAIPYATPKMARALGALIQYYRTGSPADLRAYHIAWVADHDSPVDTINGFVEVYVDARGQKGAWEGIVYFNDAKKMDLIRKIAEQAQWFEEHMPFAPQYRKPHVKGVSAKAIQVVVETGDSGPVTPIGINLPNPGDIREQYGSKSVSLSNIIAARDQSESRAAQGEFCFEPGELERELKWRELVLDLEVNLHEVIGHASGRSSPALKVDPAAVIKEYYSALEEARADLVALWFIGDPKLVELGLVPADGRDEFARTSYEMFTRNALTQLRRVRVGTQLEEDHMRNRQLIVQWLMRHTGAVAVRQREGKTFHTVADAGQWRDGVGRLLAEIQRIKSEGDREAAGKLVLGYGTHFDAPLRDEVVARFEKLNRPSYAAYVMPRLIAERDARGGICDVRIAYPLDLEAQMLEWSGRKP